MDEYSFWDMYSPESENFYGDIWDQYSPPTVDTSSSYAPVPQEYYPSSDATPEYTGGGYSGGTSVGSGTFNDVTGSYDPTYNPFNDYGGYQIPTGTPDTGIGEYGIYSFGGEGTRTPTPSDIPEGNRFAIPEHIAAAPPQYVAPAEQPSLLDKISGYADKVAGFGQKHSNLLSGAAGLAQLFMAEKAKKKAKEEYDKAMAKREQEKAAMTAAQTRAFAPLNMAAYKSGAARERLRPGVSDYRQAATSPQQRLHFAAPAETMADSMIREGQRAKDGGMIEGYAKGGATKGGLGQVSTSRLVRGAASGQSDKVPAMLSPGEYVFDADAVAAAGDGNTEAGAKKLDEMRMAMRKHKRSAPANKIPPKAKEPMQYMKGGKA